LITMPLLVARRPVFDSREQIFAYDLVVRGDVDASGLRQDVHPEQLLAEVFLEHGIQAVAGDHRVFVPASRELILGRTVRVLPAGRVILQLPSLASLDSELVAACHELASAGYRWSIDVDEHTPVVALFKSAHVIKVDVTGIAADALATLTRQLRAYPAHLLAENVQHRAERDRCAALGFDLFGGYRFSVPPILPRREIGVEQLNAFRVLRLLHDTSADDRDIEALIGADVALSFKLLRMVNTAGVGGHDIWSIGHALRLLGRDQMARWLSVLLISDTGTTGVRRELVDLALVRAHICERVADLVGVPRAGGSLFLVGLLSVLDQLLETSMTALCDAVDLAPDIRNALLHRADFFGSALRLVEAYVSGVWDEVETVSATLGISPATLQPIYLDALQWSISHRACE
jgi:EAL and modified HD-GYP domain-containing signal transduction protein